MGVFGLKPSTFHLQSWSTDEEDAKWDMKDDLADLAERGSRFARARCVRNRDKKGLFRKWSHRPGGALATGLARAGRPAIEAKLEDSFNSDKMGTTASTGNGEIIHQGHSLSAAKAVEEGVTEPAKHAFGKTWSMAGAGLRKSSGFEERNLSLPPKNYVTPSRSRSRGRQDKDDVIRRGRSAFYIGDQVSSDQSPSEVIKVL